MALERPVFSIHNNHITRFGGGSIREIFLHLYLPTTQKILKYFNYGKSLNVFFYLLTYTDTSQANIFPSAETIKEGIGAGDIETVYRALNYLERMVINGSRVLVRINRGKDEESGKWRSNTYVIFPVPEQIPESEYNRTDLHHFEVAFDEPARPGPSPLKLEAQEELPPTPPETETVSAKDRHGPYRQNADTNKSQSNNQNMIRQAPQAALPGFADQEEKGKITQKYPGKGTVAEPYLVKDKKLVVAPAMPAELRQQLEKASELGDRMAEAVYRYNASRTYFTNLLTLLSTCKDKGYMLSDTAPVGTGVARSLSVQAILTEFLSAVFNCDKDFARMGRIYNEAGKHAHLVVKAIESSTRQELIGSPYDWVQGAVKFTTKRDGIKPVAAQPKLKAQDSRRLDDLKEKLRQFQITGDYQTYLEAAQSDFNYYESNNDWAFARDRENCLAKINLLKELLALLNSGSKAA